MGKRKDIRIGFGEAHLHTFLVFRSVRSSCTNIPKIIMNNGNEMPILGLGTWGATKDDAIIENVEVDEETDIGRTKPNEMDAVVATAIDVGFRHIDTAPLHKNEKEIGIALNKQIQEKKVKRDELFIVSKLWNTFHGPDDVLCGCKKTLENLGLDYLDMYLMHTPMGFKPGDDLFPIEKGSVSFSDADYVCTWQAMEDLVEQGLCKNIGISNFNLKQIARLLKHATIIPQTHQIEAHPFLMQTELISFCKYNDICITAYAPLGSPARPWARKDTENVLLKNSTVLDIARRHEKTPAQILLRYQVQLGHAAIPKSGTCENMQNNINIFEFELRSEDMQNLDSLNYGMRLFKFSGTRNHQYYPFERC
uniref:NADP-dependent oxidoreductase domain-containing protein n=1 Tax=Glossina austeni TaxID=7395 RepID=A0A1A9VG58_GLOAU